MPLKKPSKLLLYSRLFDPAERDPDWFMPNNWRSIDQQASKELIDNPEFWDRLAAGEFVSLSTDELPGWFWLIDKAALLEQVTPALQTYFLKHAEDLDGEDQETGRLKWFKLGEMACTNLWIERLAGTGNPFGFGEHTDTWQFCLRMLVESAKTEREAFDALGQLLDSIRAESYFRVPEPLSSWEQQVTSGTIKRPRQHGKSRYSHWGRDLHISMALLRLELAGVPPTRNDESTEISGADIVADVFSRTFKRPLSYEATKAIWKRYSDLRAPLSDF